MKNRIIAILLLAALCVPLALTASAKDAEYFVVAPGDLNGNGRHEVVDYLMLKRAVLGTYTLSSDIEKTAADVNLDEKTDSVDYLMLKRSALGTWDITIPVSETADESVAAMLKADILKNDADMIADFKLKDTDLIITQIRFAYGKTGLYNEAADMAIPTLLVKYRYEGILYPQSEEDIVIGGRTFCFDGSLYPRIWYNRELYTVAEAYEQGILRDTDLESIHATDSIKD